MYQLLSMLQRRLFWGFRNHRTQQNRGTFPHYVKAHTNGVSNASKLPLLSEIERTLASEFNATIMLV